MLLFFIVHDRKLSGQPLYTQGIMFMGEGGLILFQIIKVLDDFQLKMYCTDF